ncbi:MAG: ankyrin repeat domain-containing protein, partial [Proteobacteria bacterium]|nr:ankyrin repeat domain-containing protein [Pseudomonadota bacterium]
MIHKHLLKTLSLSILLSTSAVAMNPDRITEPWIFPEIQDLNGPVVAEWVDQYAAVNQYTINLELMSATDQGLQDIVEELLGRSDGQLRPDQIGINAALGRAATNDQPAIAEFLLRHPQLRPDQRGLNLAIRSATDAGNQNIVELLLNQPAGHLRPSRRSISRAFRNAMAEGIVINYRNAMVEGIIHRFGHLAPGEELYQPPRRLITPLATIYENGGRGMTHEIHDYAGTIVTPPTPTPDSTADEGDRANTAGEARVDFAPLGQTLYDAVLENMRKRTCDQVLTDLENTKLIVDKGIEEHIKVEQQTKAKEAMGRLTATDQPLLQLVISFMLKVHPSSLQQWIKGFIEESITAYINSTTGTSCTKGIKERIATGLRGIDPELDGLFAKPEGRLL